MKSMIVIALALTSVAAFSATATKTCANLKGAELTACEAKTKAPATKEVKAVVETKEVKKDAPVVTAKNTKTTTTAAATTAPVAAPAKK